MVKSIWDGIGMLLLDVAILLLALLGVAMFLYGANYFDQVVGWAGVALVIGVVFAEIAMKLYGATRKKGEGLEAVKL